MTTSLHSSTICHIHPFHSSSSSVHLRRITNPKCLLQPHGHSPRGCFPLDQRKKASALANSRRPTTFRQDNASRRKNVAASSSPNPSPSPSSPSPRLPHSAITLIGLLGAAETAYLTYEKLFGGPVACPLGGSCNDVLNSPYAVLLGVPLPLFGFIAYSAVALLAQISRISAPEPASLNNSTPSALSFLSLEEPLQLSGGARWLLLLLTSVMTATSGYLMYLLAFELDSGVCSYCIASAVMSTSLLAATLKGFTLAELQVALLPQATAMAATAIALSLAFTDVRSALAGEQYIDLPAIEPEVTSVSSPILVKLAKHLAASGAKMYGAFWCSHCYDQKLAFGEEASKYLPYVECYPDGYRKGVQPAKACQDAKIEGFPTWIINGQALPGEQELEDLAARTGFDPSKAR